MNSNADTVEGITSSSSAGADDDAAYASLDAAETAGGEAERAGWVADG